MRIAGLLSSVAVLWLSACDTTPTATGSSGPADVSVSGADSAQAPRRATQPVRTNGNGFDDGEDNAPRPTAGTDTGGGADPDPDTGGADPDPDTGGGTDPEPDTGGGTDPDAGDGDDPGTDPGTGGGDDDGGWTES